MLPIGSSDLSEGICFELQANHFYMCFAKTINRMDRRVILSHFLKKRISQFYR